MNMPILLSASPVFHVSDITTGRGKTKKTATVTTRVTSGSAVAIWGWPGSKKTYRSRKAALKGGA